MIIILRWSSHVHLIIIWLSQKEHLKTIWFLLEDYLLLIIIWACDDLAIIRWLLKEHLKRIWYPLTDYLLLIMKMWQSFNDHPMIKIDQLPICYEWPNKQTNKLTAAYVINWWWFTDHLKIILLLFYNDYLSIIWLS